MADKTPSISEVISCHREDLAATAGADAPIIYCDRIGPKGCSYNVAAITLEAVRFQPVGEQVVTDRVVVGHLRMPLQAIRLLRAALDEIELLVRAAASTEKN